MSVRPGTWSWRTTRRGDRPPADATVASREERERKEAVNRARLQKGELGLDLYDMRKSLADKGLEYIDGPLD